VKTPFGLALTVLLVSLESPDARRRLPELPELLEEFDVAHDAGLVPVSTAGICETKDPIGFGGEPDSVETRLRLAGRSSSKSW
jgi:hypothetical protein